MKNLYLCATEKIINGNEKILSDTSENTKV